MRKMHLRQPLLFGANDFEAKIVILQGSGVQWYVEP